MSLTYDDVLLVPQPYTEIESRRQVDTSVAFGPWRLDLPLVTAPMDTIVGDRMLALLEELGGLTFWPRCDDPVTAVRNHHDTHGPDVRCAYSIGLGSDPAITIDLVRGLADAGARMVLVDIAHGGQARLIRLLDTMQGLPDLQDMSFVTGNIATAAQARDYLDPPVAAYVRVGVGSGGLCTTRLIAGTGVGQLSAIFDVAGTGLPVIADGGVRHPGDVAKAIAAGAEVVMVGSLLAGTDETPGAVVDDGTGPKKFVRGQASYSYMLDNRIEVDLTRAPEGESGLVPTRGSARTVLSQVSGGLRSAMSYTGASSLVEFRRRAVFTLVSNATLFENQPHVFRR
jgi:IMP dehydrogenase/GMP reductase